MRQRKQPREVTPIICANCQQPPKVTIDGLCPYCHAFLDEFKRHRPVYNTRELSYWIEYLDGITFELKKMAKEVKRDRDLERFLALAVVANQSTRDAMNQRIQDQR